MSKIAVVGCQASGKTVFTAALADYYRPNQRVNQLCCMTPENANANRFSEMMIHQMRDLHEWPSATNAQRTMSLKWAMRRDRDVIAQIEMLDFGGEVFRAAFRDDEGTPQNQDAVRQLVDHLIDANFIVVLVSLAEIARDINHTATDQDVVLDAESKWVTRGLLDLLKEHQSSGTKVIVALSQADRPEHKQLLETYGGAKELFEKAWPTVSAVYPDLTVISVASVSSTTMDNRPADGFKTDGVLSVMKEFVRQQFGDCDGTASRLAAAANELKSMSAVSSPAVFTRRLNEFDKLLQQLYKDTAVISELYKKEFQEYEKIKATCLQFVDVIADVERRPLDSQANGTFWREQEQLYPILAGSIRSFERYYQRKVEQQREEARRQEEARQAEIRRQEEAAARAAADAAARKERVARQFQSDVKEVVDDADNLVESCFNSRAELEGDIVSVEDKIKKIEKTYIIPDDVRVQLSALKSQLKKIRGVLVLFENVERKISEKCSSEEEWKIFWHSAESKHGDLKSIVSRIRDIYSAKISNVITEARQSELAAEKTKRKIKLFLVCTSVIAIVLIGVGIWHVIEKENQNRARQAEQEAIAKRNAEIQGKRDSFLAPIREELRIADTEAKLDSVRTKIAETRAMSIFADCGKLFDPLVAEIVRKSDKFAGERRESLIASIRDELRNADTTTTLEALHDKITELRTNSLFANHGDMLNPLATEIAGKSDELTNRERESLIAPIRNALQSAGTTASLGSLSAKIAELRMKPIFANHVATLRSLEEEIQRKVNELADRDRDMTLAPIRDGIRDANTVETLDALLAKIAGLRTLSMFANRQAILTSLENEIRRKKSGLTNEETERILSALRDAVSDDDLVSSRARIADLMRRGLTSYQKSVVKVCDQFCDRLERAQNGDTESMMWIALQHSAQKTVVKQDRAKAIEWYEKAANAGSAEAMLKLAYWAEDGKGCPKDDKKAVGWYVKAAQAKNGNAMYRLGYFYSKGLMGLKQSQDKAYEMFKHAKANGCTMNNIDEWLNVTKPIVPKKKKSSLWGGSSGDDLDDLLRDLEAGN